MIPTKRKLKLFLIDERKAVKEYRKYGFPNLAKDESRHAKFISTKLKGGK